MNEENFDIYRELQQHLDKMPIGYPSTESGIEIKILKHLFSPEEAKIVTKLQFQPEPLKTIHRRLRKSYSIEDIERKLDGMYQKGTINRGKRKEGDSETKYYASAPLVVGMFEYQLKKLTEDFIEDVNQYFKEGFWEEFNRTRIPQLRTIPIEQSIDYEQSISTYDDLKTIIENSEGLISVAECICRKGKDIIGEPCRKSNLRESCFSFRTSAEMYIEKGLGRKISKEEALRILEKAEEDGLVLQPANSLRPRNICTCCGCCCEVLLNQKRATEPAKLFATNYYAEVDEDLCVGCGICEDRCNMDAVEIIDNVSHINKARCIGCGVCVPTCTAEAITLQKKEEETIPPKNSYATYVAIMDKKAELARAEKE
jgi:NAD-dependent dihydropyrimidine dehydrogenase PreA subunit